MVNLTEEVILQNLTPVSELGNSNYVKEKGVYFLVSNSDIVYVGSSTKGSLRIMNHKSSKSFDSFYFHPIYFTLSEEELRSLEDSFIKKFTPKYNIKGIPASVASDYCSLEGFFRKHFSHLKGNDRYEIMIRFEQEIKLKRKQITVKHGGYWINDLLKLKQLWEDGNFYCMRPEIRMDDLDDFCKEHNYKKNKISFILLKRGCYFEGGNYADSSTRFLYKDLQKLHNDIQGWQNKEQYINGYTAVSLEGYFVKGSKGVPSSKVLLIERSEKEISFEIKSETGTVYSITQNMLCNYIDKEFPKESFPRKH